MKQLKMTSLTLQYSPALHAPDQPNFVSANCLAQQYSDSGLGDRRVSTVHSPHGRGDQQWAAPPAEHSNYDLVPDIIASD